MQTRVVPEAAWLSDVLPFPESEYRVRHVTGEYRWLRSRETVLTRTPDGQPHEILGLALDVTERKRLGQLLQQRCLTLKEVGPRLQRFRESLKMTQVEFGAHLGNFNQQQISNHETGRVELPLELLLSLRAHGYALEIVLGEGSTEALSEALRVSPLARQDAFPQAFLTCSSVTRLVRVCSSQGGH